MQTPHTVSNSMCHHTSAYRSLFFLVLFSAGRIFLPIRRLDASQFAPKKLRANNFERTFYQLSNKTLLKVQLYVLKYKFIICGVLFPKLEFFFFYVFKKWFAGRWKMLRILVFLLHYSVWRVYELKMRLDFVYWDHYHFFKGKLLKLSFN